MCISSIFINKNKLKQLTFQYLCAVGCPSSPVAGFAAKIQKSSMKIAIFGCKQRINIILCLLQGAAILIPVEITQITALFQWKMAALQQLRSIDIDRVFPKIKKMHPHFRERVAGFYLIGPYIVFGVLLLACF